MKARIVFDEVIDRKSCCLVQKRRCCVISLVEQEGSENSCLFDLKLRHFQQLIMTIRSACQSKIRNEEEQYEQEQR